MTLTGLYDANGNPVDVHDRPPDVPDLPLMPEEEIGPLPKGLEARLLDGNWYGNGPEIVIWHPAQQVWYSVPLRKKAFMLSHAIRVVSAAASASAAGLAPYRDGIGEGYWVTGKVASNVSPDAERLARRGNSKRGSHA